MPGPRRKAPCVRRPHPCCRPEPRPWGAPAPLTGPAGGLPDSPLTESPSPGQRCHSHPRQVDGGGAARPQAAHLPRFDSRDPCPGPTVALPSRCELSPRSALRRSLLLPPPGIEQSCCCASTPDAWLRCGFRGTAAALKKAGSPSKALSPLLGGEGPATPMPKPPPRPCAAAGIEPPQEGTWTNFKMQQNSRAEASPGC